MDTTAERHSNIGERVKRVLVDTLDLSVDPRQLLDDTSLYSPTIQMDSLNLLHLSAALENEFDGRIYDEDVLEADLEDVGSVIRLVEAKLGR
jgi:acyl carrier protein